MKNTTPTACTGSLKWPKYSQSTAVFFCEYCGHVFDRNQLQGRDDHMPPHHKAGSGREAAEHDSSVAGGAYTDHMEAQS